MRGARGGFQLLDGYRLPVQSLTNEEVAALHLLGMPTLAESSGMTPKRSTSGAAQGETPDAVTTRLGMPKLAVAARQIICLRVCSGKASEAPERISPW